MLNAELVENFQAIFRQRQSGALTVAGDDFNTRFLFQQGEVSAMDLGEDKEHLLADKLKEYHRLDATQHALVFATRERVQGTVSDIVRNLHLASDDELTQSTRAMVEDSLCAVFASEVRHIQFNAGQGLDTFNFERSAVRLRIPVETLLKTVDVRVGEIQEVQKAVKDWDAVFAFAEGGDGAGALTDFEKHVLNFVDGHRSVEEIGTACRDSSLNLARVLHGLAKKGVVRKLPSRTKTETNDRQASEPIAAVTEGGTDEPPMADVVNAPGAGGTRRDSESGQPLQGPQVQTYDALPSQPTLPPIQTSSPWGMRLALCGVLVVVALISLAIHNYNQHREQFLAKKEEVSEYVQKREWTTAFEKLEELRKDVSKDVSQTEEVNVLAKDVQADLDKEIVTIEAMIEGLNFDEARRRLERLPDTPASQDVRGHLTASQDAFTRQSNRLASDTASDLDNGEVLLANRLIASQSTRVAAAAALVRDRWRVRKIEEARSPGVSIEQRQRTLKLIRDASPAEAPLSTDQQQTITLIEDDIRRQEGRLKDQIKDLQNLADRGDYEAALTRAEKLGTAAVVRGNSDLERAFQAFQSTCDTIKSEFAQFHDDAKTAIIGSEASDRLKKVLEQGDALLAKYPAASRRSDDEALAAVLREVIDAVAQPSDVQSSLISQLMESQKLDPELSGALKVRLTRLSASEVDAQAELTTAQRHARDGDWAGAERLYLDIQKHPEWSTTIARTQADRDLIDGRAEQLRLSTAHEQLTKAIASGDIDAANQIARQIGLKYLPLVIDSQPGGADVWQGGKKIGVTPLVMDIPAAERVDYTVELRLSGYLPKSMVGAAAIGGWRLIGALERSSVAQADCGQIVTSRPVAQGGRAWVANRTTAFAISATGAVESFIYQGPDGAMPLNDPVYAPVTVCGGAMYIPTRENVAVRLGEHTDRVPLAAPSDFAMAVFESQELIDSRFLIVAGNDGGLHGLVEARPSQRWDEASGAPFACGPLVIGEQVLAVHKDGTLEASRAYDGRRGAVDTLGTSVIAAWTTASGLAGITANDAWDWDGITLRRSVLPQTAVTGSPDAIVGINGRVWLRNGAEWKDLGLLPGTPSGEPVAWQGLVVVPMGKTVQVLGARGFTATAQADFLTPVAIGPRLILISQDGKVQIYSP